MRNKAIRLAAPERRGEATRGAILEAAEQLFAEKGFLGASLADIVGEVGIAKPSLIHHFPSKGQLYAAVLERIARDVLPLTQECRACADPADGLVALAQGVDAWSAGHAHASRIVLRDMLDLANRPEPPQRWPLAFIVETIRETFERLPKRGLLRTLSFEAFLAIYLGGISYAHFSRETLKAMPYEARPADWAARARRGLLRFLEALVRGEDS